MRRLYLASVALSNFIQQAVSTRILQAISKNLLAPYLCWRQNLHLRNTRVCLSKIPRPASGRFNYHLRRDIKDDPNWIFSAFCGVSPPDELGNRVDCRFFCPAVKPEDFRFPPFAGFSARVAKGLQQSVTAAASLAHFYLSVLAGDSKALRLLHPWGAHGCYGWMTSFSLSRIQAHPPSCAARDSSSINLT
jgi:hypothetical protein